MKRYKFTALSSVTLVAVALALPACEDYENNPFENEPVQEREFEGIGEVEPLEQDTNDLNNDDLNLNAPEDDISYEADDSALGDDTYDSEAYDFGNEGDSSQSTQNQSAQEGAAAGATAGSASQQQSQSDWQSQSLEDQSQAGSSNMLGQANMKTVEIQANSFQFEPQRITAQPGQQIRINLINNGSAEHNIEFHLAGEKEASLPVAVAAGQSGTLSITAPQEPGEYEFYCPVGNHKERGMTGTLIVEGQGQSSQQSQSSESSEATHQQNAE